MQMSKIGDMPNKNLKIRVDIRARDSAFDSLSTQLRKWEHPIKEPLKDISVISYTIQFNDLLFTV